MKTINIHGFAALILFFLAIQFTSCTQEEAVTYSKTGSWKASNFNINTGANDGNYTSSFTINDAGNLAITLQDSTGTTLYNYNAETAENIDAEKDILKVFLMPPMVPQPDTVFAKIRYELNQDELYLTVYESSGYIDSARASTVIDSGPTLYISSRRPLRHCHRGCGYALDPGHHPCNGRVRPRGGQRGWDRRDGRSVE
jgi:hypothetical protein